MEASEDRTESVYSCKKVASFENHPVEMYADEVIQMNNREVIYTDLYVQLYFNMDDLPSQKIFNEEALEVSPLDTPANYRTKFQVSLSKQHYKLSECMTRHISYILYYPYIISQISKVNPHISSNSIFKDAACAYFGAKYKWDSFRSGPLAQRLPEFTPGREFISSSRADLLKVIKACLRMHT